MNERELYYELINFENVSDYEGLLLKCSQLLKDYISQVLPTIAYFEYDEKALDDFLLKDNQKVQEKYATYVAENPPPRSREDMIMYLTQLTPAKFVDGAWLQGVARAHNLNLDGNTLRAGIVNDLFNIYVEELGEGVVEMNHVAIWQQLLGSLGINLPEPSSHSFCKNELLWDSSFSVGVIQLALGHLSTSHLPEVLGYNMGFEQLPLHLLTTVDEMRKLGMDAYYFQLHISIDNLASGHGAVATHAVKKYMDEITTKYGKEKAEEHWKRILAGFYLNNVSPMKIELAEYYSSKKQESLEDRMVKMLKQKTPYAHQMHADRQIGGCPLNKWLAPTSTDANLHTFLSHLLASHWVDSQFPNRSRFLTELCGFGGAMFHVFSRPELQLLEEWITSNAAPQQPQQQNEPSLPTTLPNPKTTISESDAEISRSMAVLIRTKSARARSAHRNRTMVDSKGTSRKIDEWLEIENPNEAMDALRHTYSLDKIAEEKEEKTIEEALADNPFYKSVSIGRMKSYFTPKEVETIKNWIIAGAPILHSSSPFSSSSPSTVLSSPSSLSPPSLVSIPPAKSSPSFITFPSFSKPSGCPFSSKQQNNKAANNKQIIANNKLSLPSLDDLSPPSLSTLFYQLINNELYPHSLSHARNFLESHFSSLSPSLSSSSPSSYRHQSEVENKIQEVIANCDSLQQLANIGKQLSLFFFMEGMCLQNVNLAGFHHTHMNSQLMKIFMNIWGYEDPLKNHHQMFNNILKLLRVQLPPINSSFISNCGFSSKITEFAVLQLAVSLFPRAYFTEIITFLEWNLSFNKVVLESLVSRMTVLGGYTFDSATYKTLMQEYESNIRMCKEVEGSHKDEARMRGDSHAIDTLSGNTRHLCCNLAEDVVRHVSETEAVAEFSKQAECKLTGRNLGNACA